MVLPSISPLSDSSTGHTRVEVPPPPRFRPLKGPITQVRLGAECIIQGRITSDMSLAKIAGIKYEQQFLMFLRKEFPQVYIRPHVHFRDGGDHRTVIPDAVLFCDDDQGRPQTKIFEVKRQHMPEAWWQLERLYRPVLQAAFPSHYIACVEVVRTYDSQMPWPEEHVLFNDLKHAVLSSDKIGVLKWRKP